MPTYSYECDTCGHRFSLFQGMTDPPVDPCPECGGPVKRLIGTGAGILFKNAMAPATNPQIIRPSCGRDTPCCGRSTPCEIKSCNK